MKKLFAYSYIILTTLFLLATIELSLGQDYSSNVYLFNKTPLAKQKVLLTGGYVINPFLLEIEK